MVDYKSSKKDIKNKLKEEKNIDVTMKDLWNMELAARAMSNDKNALKIIKDNGIYVIVNNCALFSKNKADYDFCLSFFRISNFTFTKLNMLEILTGFQEER